MKWVVNAASKKAVDTFSIKEIGIPSVVLMERAAEAVTNELLQDLEPSCRSHILCVCGKGNNGADGLCVARQLMENNLCVDIWLVSEGEGTEEYELHRRVLSNLSARFVNNPDMSEYDYIVDAVFGIGLSRNIEGRLASVIDYINSSKNEKAKVYAVDVPSGINIDNGRVMGHAVKADVTVTFGYEGIGQLLYPGANYCGKLIVKNIGFAGKPETDTFTFDDSDFARIPERIPDGNKGTFGKALIVAGSKNMGGAAILSAKSAYQSGLGLVKVYTHKDNKEALLTHVPECIIDSYENLFDKEKLINGMEWADCMVAGPGIGTDSNAVKIVRCICGETSPVKVLDADALNIVAEHNICVNGRYIVTPHVGEMSRLTGKSIKDIKGSLIETAKEYAMSNSCICVLKDARTIVTDGKKVYINKSGNDGMATGGSGDVLTGVIAGLLGAGLDAFEASCLGVYIHGRAGDMAADRLGHRAMTAGDIANEIINIYKNC
ncbi:MAG: NAD(P)H-hydrate dehydratase [Lachnospira sp.]